MTSLFAYLIERSVRAPSVAAVNQRSDSPATARARREEAEPAPDGARGAITPRRRTRYERGPGSEPPLGDTVAFADGTSRLQPTDEQSRVPEEPNDIGGATESIGAPMARAPAETLRPSRPASGRARLRPVESASQSTAPIAPSVEAAADSPAASSRQDAAGAAEPPRPPAPRPPERAPAPRDVASVESLPAPPRGRSFGDATAPQPRSSRPPVAQVMAPPSVPPKLEPAMVRPGEMLPARQRSPLRQSPPPSALIRARASSDQPSVPSVQISIGRVEVRAVYAPPPSAAPRPSPALAMSLDDYLKLREKG